MPLPSPPSSSAMPASSKPFEGQQLPPPLATSAPHYHIHPSRSARTPIITSYLDQVGTDVVI
jgi:hypothetical protein